MPCLISTTIPEGQVGLTDVAFSGAIVSGTGTLTYNAGGYWEVTPKPSAGACTVRFTPLSTLDVDHLFTVASLTTSGNYKPCDGVSGVVAFVGGSPADVTLTGAMDTVVSGRISHVDVTYQNTYASSEPWTIGVGAVYFTEATASAALWTPRFFV